MKTKHNFPEDLIEELQNLPLHLAIVIAAFPGYYGMVHAVAQDFGIDEKVLKKVCQDLVNACSVNGRENKALEDEMIKFISERVEKLEMKWADDTLELENQ